MRKACHFANGALVSTPVMHAHASTMTDQATGREEAPGEVQMAEDREGKGFSVRG